MGEGGQLLGAGWGVLEATPPGGHAPRRQAAHVGPVGALAWVTVLGPSSSTGNF